MTDIDKLCIRAAYTYLSEAIDMMGMYPDKIVFGADYMSPISLANPLSVMLTEGLIKSYPTDKSVEYIKNLFNLPDDAIKAVEYNGIEKLLITFIPKPENWDALLNAANLCGFFLSRPKPSQIYNYIGRQVRLEFEKKYSNDLFNELKSKGENLIHLTPLKNVDKIRNIGLIPAAKNLAFNYPERVYLLKESTPDDIIDWLCKALSKVYTCKRQKKRIDYAKIVIDINKLKEDTKLFQDPNLPKFGLFTTDNIPPNAIKNVKEIKINI